MTKDEIESMIEEARSGPTSDWERDFLDSVEEQLEERGFLSSRQVETIEKIISDQSDRHG